MRIDTDSREKNIAELAVIVEKVQGGDRKAFSELYKMTEHMVVYVIRSRGVAEDDVKDVAQETYYKIFEKIGTIADPQKAYGWIRKVAFTTACNHMNSAPEKNEITTPEEDLTLEDPLWKEEIELPEDIVVRGEAMEQLAALVKELPEDVHQLLVAKYYNEMSFPEISKAFGINENTVKTKIRRALDKMNRQMRSMGTTTLTITPAPILIYRLLSAEAEKSAIPAGLATGVGAITVGNSTAAVSTTAAAVSAQAKAGLVLGFLSKRAAIAVIIGTIAIGGGAAAAVNAGVFRTEKPVVETTKETVTESVAVVTETPKPTQKATPTPTKKATPKPTKKATPTPTKKATPTPTKKETPKPTATPKATTTSKATTTPKQETTPKAETPVPTKTLTKTPTTAPAAHTHTWVENTKTVTDKEAWDEQVKTKDAWDEQVVVKEAWDEQVMTKEAWDEQVQVSEAWDEPVYEYVDVCNRCGYTSNDPYEFTLHCLDDNSGYHTERIQVDTIHHDAGYETVHHDAEYTTIHHDAEYTTVHHDAEYTTVHHDAVTHTETTYTCSGCRATK